MFLWWSFLSTSWCASRNKNRKAISGKPRRNKTMRTCIQTHSQAFKVNGNISHLSLSFNYVKHNCKNDRDNVPSARSLPSGNSHNTWRVNCTVGNNIFPGWAAQHWSKLPRKDRGISILRRAMADCIYWGPCSSRRLTFGCPIQLTGVIFSPLSTAILPCHFPFSSSWHPCILTSKGS